jgi:NAD(P)-dependent dehydrogenase (short-subunit alcohol dehydrogenase family)
MSPGDRGCPAETAGRTIEVDEAPNRVWMARMAKGYRGPTGQSHRQPERIRLVSNLDRPTGGAPAQMPLADRVVLVAGATGSLGRATAAVFAGGGARVVLCGTNQERLKDLAAGLHLEEARWAAAVGDLRTPEGARSVASVALERFDRIDILVQTVGGFVPGSPVVDLDHEQIRMMLDQHLWTSVNLVQAVVPGMVERGWGRVLAATSFTTATTPAKAGLYAATKGAQENLLRSLAKEVASNGVTVNLVALRAIDENHERGTDPKKAAWTTPEEIAAVFRFLASDDAAPINGARIPLDGRA